MFLVEDSRTEHDPRPAPLFQRDRESSIKGPIVFLVPGRKPHPQIQAESAAKRSPDTQGCGHIMKPNARESASVFVVFVGLGWTGEIRGEKERDERENEVPTHGTSLG